VLIGAAAAHGTSYDVYFEGAQFIHFLLGPATVALAIPLYDNLRQIRRLLLPLLLACLLGVSVAVSSAVGLAWLAGGRDQTLLSIAPKSVTTPIAMGIAEQIGGLPSLAAGIVLLTGAVGVVAARPLFRLARIATSAPRASRWASPRTASAPRMRLPSACARAPSPAWGSAWPGC
jgi:putative effector of murein hydrolase